ncbi:MAG: Fe-S metabolism protein SufE [Candidatus Neomarinimicrobiota bacterium]|nr:MAG: Fe-S metabolism protein SufE [Candidatus Neomarinimicrobiota bacterium]
MNMQQQLTSLRELFMLFEDPKDKFVQLMDMAKESEQLKENEKVEQNKINGCTSRAWVVTKQNGDDTYTFRTDSDSLIVKGLLTILEQIFSGQTADNILSINSSDILYSIGLDKTITSQRTNGFSSAVQKIHNSLK